MKLGESVQIVLGVKDISENVEFYKKMGFRLLAEDQEPWPWAIFTDGKNRIMINQDGNIYTGLIYVTSDFEKVRDHIKSLGIELVAETEVACAEQTIFRSPNGILFGIISAEKSDEGLTDIEEPFILGELGELSWRVSDLDSAITFWERLGFECKHKSNEPYQWGILYDGMVPLGLHNSDDVPTRPTMTYFGKDQSKSIEMVREKGLRIARELGERHITIEGPDGQQLNIFQWEGDLEYSQ